MEMTCRRWKEKKEDDESRGSNNIDSEGKGEDKDGCRRWMEEEKEDDNRRETTDIDSEGNGEDKDGCRWWREKKEGYDRKGNKR